MMKGILLSGLLCCLILKSSGQPVMNVLLGYQDSLGQYSFGYSTLNSARSEIKTVNGVIRGAYSYVDDNGVIQTTEYIADDDGFHVISTNLPQSPLPVEDTAEVLAARKAHFEAFLIAEQMTKQVRYEKKRKKKRKEEKSSDQQYYEEENLSRPKLRGA
ncbi:cuticle protein 7-like [Vespula squamosa]|uniref:Cuticle protein 7-like n=1 Tax=Vespula squamosa TaxID=30214 RepID=A0ABD2AEQ9_VESSQ